MKNKLVLVILTFGLVLNSCFVAKLNTNWQGKCNTIDTRIADSLANKLPDLSIEIGRKPHFWILPFVFVIWDNKDYGISYNLSSFTTDYNKIDSVLYFVLNEEDSILWTDIIRTNKNSGLFRCSSSIYQSDSMCFASCETDYIYKYPISEELNLKLNGIIYLTNKNNQNLKYSYHSCVVNRRGKKFGSFF